MRSSGSKIAKSVSICSEPVTENGFRSKKEEDAELQAIAAELVENVVRTAKEQATGSMCNTNPKDQEDEETERLPTIHIETVPSMPPSPTDWPPPPPEHIILEEDEEEEEEEQENDGTNVEAVPDASTSEIQNFAVNYVEEIVSKAIQVAEERQKSRDEEEIREIAARVVRDVLERANESAAERLTAQLNFPESLPTIQIDTVLSMPASPEDDARPHQIPEIIHTQYEENADEMDSPQKELPNNLRNLVKHSEAPEELRDFASSYVKEIVSKALAAAEEKMVAAVPFSFEDGEMKLNGPWYIRFRETLMRILRSACFCTPRREDS